MTELLMMLIFTCTAVVIIILQIIMIVRTGSSRGQNLEMVEKATERSERAVREEIARNREEAAQNARLVREEVSTSLKSVNDSLIRIMSGLGETQQKQMDSFSERLAKLTESNQQKLDLLKAAVEEKLKALQDDNALRLEQMRVTVDEKLQGTLEKRLGESFRQVSERLEQVYKGLGEMQSLASGVGDLKRMLTNVKTRGTWGEVQLGAMLEQVLTPDQYEANVATKGGGERVEYAVRFPGKSADGSDVLWLPIDAKFPLEDYQRLLDAQERADAEGAEAAARQLETRIKQCAADISKKYLNPPATTDFGILFLPTEGLFAEVLRRTGLPETIQRQHRVIIAGPTTLWSILNSLQMGFKTLAIEKRSSEVWKLLSAIKTEWSKYGAVLSRVHKKLGEASNTIEEAQVRTRVIGKKLRDVEEMPLEDAMTILPADASIEEAPDNDAEEES